MPSTRDPSALPAVDDLRRLCQSLAMLDAILSPEWEYRYHSFDSRWNDGQEMASLRDGCGNSYFFLFSSVGAILKGFVRDSEVWRNVVNRNQPISGLFDDVPAEFVGFLTEPAFSIPESTFCLWRRRSDPTWQTGKVDSLQGEDPDGSGELLRLLDGNPEAYRLWAEDYYETSIEREAVEQVMAYRPLTAELVRLLNPELSLIDLEEELAEIAYPTS